MVKLPEHEHSTAHKKCYLAWRELERRLEESSEVDMLHDDRILSEAHKWKQILARIIHVVVFLGERVLPFRGSSQRIGDIQNGNFLGLIELLAHYDPVLRKHVTKIQVSQEKGERLQAHYLSASSQNEFTGLCAEHVHSRVMDETDDAKYYSIMVDATPDSCHVEQTTFIIRYLTTELQEFFVQERFLTFVDCCKETGLEIAMLILETLKQLGIPLADCRGQGYDNAANMSGKYNGAQQHILAENPLCLYSPCACHSLNLCGADSAACFPSDGQFFKKILDHHCTACQTDRVASVRPFAAQLPGICSALEQLHALNLTPKTATEVNGAVKYISSFTCILMSTIWFKILVAIDQRNQIIQARQVTIDVEVSNLKSLVNDLKDLRSKWDQIFNEVKLVAEGMQMDCFLPAKRKKKRRPFSDETQDEVFPEGGVAEEEAAFEHDVFYVILDSVIAGLSTRYDAAHKIDDLFGFLWKYLALTEQQISKACVTLAKQYKNDISQDELTEEMVHLKAIHAANFGDESLTPFSLLKKFRKFKLAEIFPNVCIALRIFCTLPVTVASAERPFSKLKLIKNFLRSTMTQDRLNDLAILGKESDLTRFRQKHRRASKAATRFLYWISCYSPIMLVRDRFRKEQNCHNCQQIEHVQLIDVTKMQQQYIYTSDSDCPYRKIGGRWAFSAIQLYRKQFSIPEVNSRTLAISFELRWLKAASVVFGVRIDDFCLTSYSSSVPFT
ncbi:zinc finger MYM-type protein 1-like [Penaeus indicus]|uniref:zinc finger MYM-type protein 1-like n=1 Tax=Penaeus indicus TaxID=29960 RepID=UPI00300CDB75